METQTQHAGSALSDVRLAVLRQHTQLAQLLDELELYAEAVIGGRDAPARMNDALVLLHRRFMRHLEFEETQLMPLLATVLPERTAALSASLAEHAEQRSRLDGLLRDRTVFADDPQTLAREALAFVHAIRTDIAGEEQGLRALG